MAATTASTSTAFTPLKVGEMELQHRIALAPLTRVRADADHVLHDISAEYYAQRASYPGTLLISEATIISQAAGGIPNVPGLYNDAQIAGWKKVVDAVHAKGSFIYLQLWHQGRAASEKVLKAESPALEVVSASDIAFEGGDKPRPLTVDEIHATTADYAAAAKAFVEQCGGDGVEIHMANGYLLHQFLDTNSNKRTDQYGGSVENRARFPLEVAAAVTAAVGANKVGVRFAPFTTFQGMGMPKADREATYLYMLDQFKSTHPELAYIHLVEPRIRVGEEVDVAEGDSLEFLTDAWAPRPVLLAGGYKEADAELVTSSVPNSVAVYGRYFISNPDLVARIKHKVPFVPYDRATFYLVGPDQPEGYTTYPVVYGPEGKL